MPLISFAVVPSFRTYTSISIAVYLVYIALSCYYEDFQDSMEFLQHQYEHFWTDIFLLNLLTCFIIKLGRLFVSAVFGPLRGIEEQNLHDKINHFSLYKFVFLFGVLNLGEVGQVTRWSAWCGALAVIFLLDKLCKDRAGYLALSPTTTLRNHLPSLTITLTLHVTCVLMFFGVCYWRDEDNHITLFLLADVLIHYLQTLYTLIRQCLIIYDMYVERWENKDITFYYTELVLEVVMLYLEMFHNIHMLLYSGVLLSMGSFVLCMHIKQLYNELCKRWQRHKNFRSIMNSMASQFRDATTEELEANNDHCAICWDSMETARKLPCGHMFHISCLRSWLEHDTSCPTCRLSLSDPNQPPQNPAPQSTYRNMAWHIRGSSWASWLPNFSVHVIRSPQHIELDMRMIEQVSEVLPHVPRQDIEHDLRRTLNPQVTIENMLRFNDQNQDGGAEVSDSDDSIINDIPEQNYIPENTYMSDYIPDHNYMPESSFLQERDTSAEENMFTSYDEDESAIRRRRLLAAVERRWGGEPTGSNVT